MGLPMVQNFSNEAALGLNFVEAMSLKPLDAFMPFKVIWNCLDLVHHHCHFVPHLGFLRSNLKILYLRNGRVDWHGTKGMWVDRMLHSLCDFQLWPQPWPWPWVSKVKFWKSRIPGMGWPIDMEQKGCESIACWTYVVTFSAHLAHDLELGFFMVKFFNSCI